MWIIIRKSCHRHNWSCIVLEGVSHPKMTETLLGSIKMPPEETWWPRKSKKGTQNLYFSSFAYRYIDGLFLV